MLSRLWWRQAVRTKMLGDRVWLILRSGSISAREIRIQISKGNDAQIIALALGTAIATTKSIQPNIVESASDKLFISKSNRI